MRADTQGNTVIQEDTLKQMVVARSGLSGVRWCDLVSISTREREHQCDKSPDVLGSLTAIALQAQRLDQC